MAMNKIGRFELSKSFHEDLKSSKKSPTLAVQKSIDVPVISHATYPEPQYYKTYNYVHWVNFYTRFILECEVPAKLEGSNVIYAGNKFSEDGMKAFQKALKDGFEYKGLVMAVKLYYKSTIRFKKAIGKYMKDGEWRTDYAEIINNANSGTLEKHIKDTMNEGTGTNYTLG